jgi:hypothetical protein
MPALNDVLVPPRPVVWRRLAVALWFLILLGGLGRALVNPSRSNVGVIYRESIEAAQRWVQGEPVYPLEWRWEMFPYGPCVALLFVPFSYLPESIGSGLWRLFVGVAYLLALGWWSRSALPRPLAPGQRALLFLLVIPVTASTVMAGQLGGLVAATVLLTLAAAAEERWTAAAVFAVAACLLKAYPVAVALLLLITHPRRVAVRLGGIGLLGLALPFLFQSPGYVVEQYSRWFHLLVNNDRHNWPLIEANRNLSLLFRVWLVPLDRHLDLALQLLSAAGAAGLCLAGQRQGWPHRQLLLNLLALAGCWMTLFGPAVESYTYILIGPTLAWMLLEAWEQRRPLFYRGLLATAWGIFTAASVAVWFGNTTRLHNLGPHPLAGTWLLVALLWELGKQFAAPKEKIAIGATPPARAA